MKSEQKRKIETLHPIIVAPCYSSASSNFSKLKIHLTCSFAIDPFFLEVDARKNLTPELLQDLLVMIDGKKCGARKIVEKFTEKYPVLSKSFIDAKIKYLAVREARINLRSVIC
jgi:hypothetical protein